MKLLSHYVGLLILGLVVVPLIKADISLKLKNQQYLPASANNVQESSASSNQQTFEESKYGNSRYQVFEVHNRFEPNQGQAVTNVASGNGNDHGSAATADEIRIEHINAPPGFPLDNPELDASLLKVATEGLTNNQEIVLKHENAPTPSPVNINVPFPSNYRHDFSQKPSTQNFVEYDKTASGKFGGPPYLPPSGNGRQVTDHTFRAPGYLPPTPSRNNGGRTPFKGPGYLPPPSRGSSHQVIENPFRGSDYLPPPPAHGDRNLGQSSFKAPDYLPPHRNGRVPSQPFHGNQFRPPTPGSSVDHNVFKASDYLPPNGGGSVTGQHNQQGINSNNEYLPPSQQSSSVFESSEYLPPPQSGSSQQTASIIESPEYLSPPQSGSSQQSAPIIEGSEYLPPPQSGSQQQSSPVFERPDYLPPPQSDSQQQTFHPQNAFNVPDYVPPASANEVIPQESFEPENISNGQDYLPPQSSQSHQQPQETPQQYPVNNDSSLAPGLLPPGYDFQKPNDAEEAIAELHTLPEQQENTNYQQTQVNVQSQIQVAGEEQSPDIVYGKPKQGNSPQAPSSLPQDYDFTTPAASGVSHDSSIHQQSLSSPSTGYHSPDYLPPALQSQREGRAYNAPGQLPQGYDFQKPAEIQEAQGYQSNAQQQGVQSSSSQSVGGQQQSFTQAQASHVQSHTYHSQTQDVGQQNVQSVYKGPGYLPPSSPAQNANTVFQGPGYLPPAGSSAATAQVFRGPGYLPPGGAPSQSVQVFKGPGYLPPVGAATQSGVQQYAQVFQGPGYLPPAVVTHTGAAHIFQGPGYLPPQGVAHTISSPAFNSPAYLPPSAPVSTSARPNAQRSAFKASGYLPPTAAPITSLPAAQPTVMYPLSSYMNEVQPYDRYGRKPFPEYGPPPTPTSPTNEVAPMYKEPASRPQYYAPAMSYSQNGVSSQSYKQQTNQHYQGAEPALSQQTRQTLRTFMPKDIRQDITPPRSGAGNAAVSSSTGSSVVHSSVVAAKVPTATTASAKIRTVQIVNTNTVKTLKVLESLDHAGVKTIQILGPSNEEPMGQHRVVKVVSGRENTVQTVKIYNDQKDAPAPISAPASVPATSPPNNDYLPPRYKRNPTKVNGRGRQLTTRH